MGDNALEGGKVVKISTDLLKDFATMNLQSFIDELKGNQVIDDLSLFASGSTGGVSPNGSYAQVLPANTEKGELASAKKLQADFQALATLVDEAVQNLYRATVQMQSNLKLVSTVLTDASDEAELTAAEMQEDLANVDVDGAAAGGGAAGGGGVGGRAGEGGGGPGAGGKPAPAGT
ncbi:hypothetical protein Kisp01_71830 [Kineosporia sp. NBRC 101677]|uniref:hypothetical protein n=1 Tax=Kineosporia sp. NBRC 101677 TaxID=3032197 RepID=UPI00249FC308|nr:hypothetical protein [Kineosporia sp. NBRC 101677]GLY20169.1 hypothetical protein Kisp01_71830 [Kineosporia sp. NBRC 101677]